MTTELIVAGTGHRPPRLSLGYDRVSREKLLSFTIARLGELGKVGKIISGAAQGFDQALAIAARQLSIPYVVAVPFIGQDAKWPIEARSIYQDILDYAQDVVMVSDGGYAARKFVERDRWMVDHCSLLMALWDGNETGGTWHTVAYAQKKGVKVKNVWEAWEGVFP